MDENKYRPVVLQVKHRIQLIALAVITIRGETL
jgi:hypothetical protein